MDAPARPRLALRDHLRKLDVALILLAFASLVLFVAARTGVAAETRVLLALDLAIVAAYATVFAAKWAHAREPARWFRRRAVLLLGLAPLTLPFVADPWFLLVQVAVLLVRAGKALDRAFGAHVMEGLAERYKSMVVEELAEPLLWRLADVLEDSLTSRDYAAAMGERLAARRDLVEAAVRRAIVESPKLSYVARFGPVQRLVDETTKEVVDGIHAALTGPELNQLIREALHDACHQLKDGIRERKWVHKGVGLADVAHGITEGAARLVHPRAHEAPVVAAGARYN